MLSIRPCFCLCHARANQSVLGPSLLRWPQTPIRHQPRTPIGETDWNITLSMGRLHLPSPVDRSSLEGLHHGFDSGCNSRVWAGRGKKNSIAHCWMFYSNLYSPNRERATNHVQPKKTTRQTPTKRRRYTRDPTETIKLWSRWPLNHHLREKGIEFQEND